MLLRDDRGNTACIGRGIGPNYCHGTLLDLSVVERSIVERCMDEVKQLAFDANRSLLIFFFCAVDDALLLVKDAEEAPVLPPSCKCRVGVPSGALLPASVALLKEPGTAERFNVLWSLKK